MKYPGNERAMRTEIGCPGIWLYKNRISRIQREMAKKYETGKGDNL